MTFYRTKHIEQFNKQQVEDREGIPNLFVSMVQAKEGDSRNLELQAMTIRKLFKVGSGKKAKNRIEEDILFVDNRLNKLVKKLTEKYGQNRVYKFGVKQGRLKLGVSASNKVFDEQQIQSLLMQYIMMFPFGVLLLEDFEQEVWLPDIYNFKGETNEHSNNKLMKYITTTFEKQVLVQELHKDKKTKRIMQDGKYIYVNQKAETYLFGDLEPTNKEDYSDAGEPVHLEDVLTDGAFGFEWEQQSEFEYIKENYQDVLTNNQLLCFNHILEAITDEGFVIDDLFREVFETRLNIEAVGKILFPDKENNYRQPAVRKLFKSMKQRMDKQLSKDGISDERNIVRSDYRPLPDHPMEDNKKFKDYKINEKYLSKNYYINDLHKNVKCYTDEQVIPLYEYINLLTGKVTVTDLINTYKIDKERAKLKNGAVYTYNLNSNGEYILTDKSWAEDDGNNYKYVDSKNVKYK